MTEIDTITEEQLVAAIISVLGEKRFNAINTMGLVAAHEKACMRAFISRTEGPEIDVLRECWKHISKTGSYSFYEANAPRM